MKNLFFIASIFFLAMSISSCQTSRRGVRAYFGDKNLKVIESQKDLVAEKKADYEVALASLQRERARQLSSLQFSGSQEIRRNEVELRRLQAELEDLYRGSHSLSGQTLLDQKASLEEEIGQKEERLNSLRSGEDYPESLALLDAQISKISSLLLNMQLEEDEMLVTMMKKDNL